MAYTSEPEELAAAYRPLRFTNEQTSTEDVESIKVEVKVGAVIQATYRKPYAIKDGNDYTFYIDAQSPIQRYLAPRTDAAAPSTIFPALSGFSAINAADCYANYSVVSYLEYRSSAGLLVTSTAGDQSTALYAYAAKRPANDITMTDYYYQGSGKFKWLTDGPSAQDIGSTEAAAICASHKSWDYVIYKFYSGGAFTSSGTTNAPDLTNPLLFSIDTGPANLPAIDFNVVDYYTVELGTSGGTAYSEAWAFNVVKRCTGAKRFYWMNSLGGVDQYTFEGQIIKVHTHGGNIGEINQPIPTDSDLEGLVKTGITSQVKYKITEVLDADIADWLRNMFISPEVYMELNGLLWLVTIEPGSVDIDTSNEAQQEFEFTVLFENEITQAV